MNSKKMTVKRLIIFLLIAFVPFWFIIPALNSFYGEPIFMCEEAAATVYVVGVFGMLIPSIAHFITRIVTKEGFKNSYLGLNFKGNAKYYIASVVIKVIEAVIGALFLWRTLAGDLSFSEAFTFDRIGERAGTLLMQISASIIIFFPAFGEEWGWRGYMMPKLTELMGRPAAIVVGGVIWGLWHAPLTIEGHNFGVDYDFYPLGGILFMCVYCILMNALLTLFTEKTGSIYPASFCHMINNNLNPAIFLSIWCSEAFVEKVTTVTLFDLAPITLILSGITAVISFIILIKSDRKIKK